MGAAWLVEHVAWSWALPNQVLRTAVQCHVDHPVKARTSVEGKLVVLSHHDMETYYDRRLAHAVGRRKMAQWMLDDAPPRPPLRAVAFWHGMSARLQALPETGSERALTWLSGHGAYRCVRAGIRGHVGRVAGGHTRNLGASGCASSA